MTKFLGLLMVLLAMVLAIAPGLTDCASQGKALTTADGRSVAMKCHWTARAELAAAVPLGLAGLYALFGRRRETKRFAAVMGAASGVVAVLLCTTIIGTCMSPSMYCNVAMKPVVLASGILAFVVSAALYVTARETEVPATGAAA